VDIQTRKLIFIQEFLKIQSEELISRLEKILIGNEDQFNSFSIEELNARIDQSLKDSENNKVTESDDLLSEIKQWQ